MVTEVKSLEEEVVAFQIELAAVNQEFLFAFSRPLRMDRVPLTPAGVDRVDVLYCRVESACDAMRRALVARQRPAAEAAAREAR